MIKEKKIFTLSFLFMVMWVLPVFCGGSSERAKENVKIGVSVISVEAFQYYIKLGIDNYDKENTNTLFDIRIADNDMETQIKDVNDFLTMGYQAILIRAVDSEGTAPISEACKKAGVPLIVVNSSIGSSYDTFVASEEKAMGKAQAAYLAELAKGQGNVAIFVGDPNAEGARMRTEGFHEVLDSYPDLRLIVEESAFWDRKQAYDISVNWIEAGLPIDIIMANNDEMVIGAISAYKEAGKDGGLLFGGVDATEEALRLLKEGSLQVTIFQNGISQGYIAAKTAYEYTQGKKLASYIDVPYEVVTPDRADEILQQLTK
ncbi:substrate-binding domain-containing protein [Spirochaeta cellobiosiphila]|uniref:substrate-binding domain-containing protein n=1 Tax=Spirochaeta cellobiosiphila TaxID=504483 RepID=UPI0004220E38|nr:substrate-binding domain-containing protein [Spirochaeta cellobiosiphila]